MVNHVVTDYQHFYWCPLKTASSKEYTIKRHIIFRYKDLALP